jgi:hypothetical protein
VDSRLFGLTVRWVQFCTILSFCINFFGCLIWGFRCLFLIVS